MFFWLSPGAALAATDETQSYTVAPTGDITAKASAKGPVRDHGFDVDVWINKSAARTVEDSEFFTHYQVETCSGARSVVVVDEASHWVPTGRPEACFSQQTVDGGATKPVGVECRYSRAARLQAMRTLREDLSDVLNRVFDIEHGTCIPSRESEEQPGEQRGRAGIFSYLTNSSLRVGDIEDSLHSDIEGTVASCAASSLDAYITA